jgi:hypothetical protein
LGVVAGFIAVIGITAPHRIRAGSRERLDPRKEGAVILATLRPAGAVLWIGIIAYLISPASMAWSAIAPPAEGSDPLNAHSAQWVLRWHAVLQRHVAEQLVFLLTTSKVAARPLPRNSCRSPVNGQRFTGHRFPDSPMP